ncbi:MAG: bifunctional helix-turn-helix transcriptional regulator/GNAT family N-acetyltransferase [Chloroflexi bacterium]|nr:bifunctional helix-turn-helix transcriptional regulator/GNAT family N-acetyltransferase [Chloroflexota bacterium]
MTQVADPQLDERVAEVRHFNRFYTRLIGLLQDGYLHSSYSLTEVRVLYELAHHQRTTAAELARWLDLDPGYLSRMLGTFLKHGLLERTPAHDDRRQVWLSLSSRGREVFAPLDAASADQISKLLQGMRESDQQRLVAAMHTLEATLGERPPTPDAYVLRQHQPGDMGWVVQRHGVLYAREYGFDERFEALVASIVAKFIDHLDPQRERCWIAERDGEQIGCVFLVKASEKIGKLRLFLVEPEARGLGVGTRLVDECLRFARQAGYEKVRLWTQSNLLAARRIYERAGFRCIKAEPHHSWGQDLVSETWELGFGRMG